MLVVYLDKIKHKCYSVYIMETTTHSTPETNTPQEQNGNFKELYNTGALRDLADTIKTNREQVVAEANAEGIHAFNRIARVNSSKKETINAYIDAHFGHFDDTDEDAVDEFAAEREAARQDIRAILAEPKSLRRRNLIKTLVSERNEQFGLDVEETEEPEDESSSPEDEETLTPIEAAEQKLDSLRTNMATLNAKRQARLFSLKRSESARQYETLQAEYNTQIQELGKLKLADTLEDESLSDLEKNKEVISFLFDEQGRLREESKEIISNSKLSKGIEWFNRGNTMTRIGKGAIIGAGAAVVGAGLGAVAGVAGVAAAGAGLVAGATAAGRFARGFARSDAKKGRGMDELDASHKDAAVDHIGRREKEAVEEASLRGLEPVATDKPDAFTSAQEYFTSQLESDTSAEQKKRRKSVAAGLGGIALGAGVGFAAQAALDAGVFDGWMNRTVVPTVEATPEIEPPEDTGPDTEPAFPDGSGEPEPEPTPEITYDPAFYVEAGEGGISLFQGMGLSEANWYEVHQELLQNFPNEFYSEGGDTRLAQPGQLSLEAQQYIKNRFGLA